MNVSVKDASDYFRGLLVLMAKDRRISAEEVEVMHHVGKSLGFEKKFYSDAINEILENKFVLSAPPVFPTKELARCFIRDGLKLAFADGEIHSFEEGFLRSTAGANRLEEDWFWQEKEKILSDERRDAHLEVDNLVVKAS